MPDISLNNEHPVFKLIYRGDIVSLKKAIQEDNSLAFKRTNDGTSTSLLIYAAKLGQIPILHYLIKEIGLSPDDQDFAGVTALMKAAHHGHFKTLKWLIKEGGASWNITNNQGQTSLIYAIAGDHFEIVKWLIQEAKIPANVKSNNDVTPLMFTVMKGRFQIMKWLVEVCKVSVHEKEMLGNTAFKYAVFMNRFECVKWLCEECKVSINEKDKGGRTALMLTAYKNFVGTAQWLVERGHASINEKDKKGVSILMAAVEAGSLEMVRFLLKQPSLSYQDILLAREYASKPLYRSPEIRDLLKEYIERVEEIITKEKIVISENLLCPITHCLFIDPVTASDGYTYEKSAITKWLSGHNTSPMTREIINQKLYPSIVLRKYLQIVFENIEKAIQKHALLKVQGTSDKTFRLFNSQCVSSVGEKNSYSENKGIEGFVKCVFPSLL